METSLSLYLQDNPAVVVILIILGICLVCMVFDLFMGLSAKDLEELDRVNRDENQKPIAVWKTREDSRVSTLADAAKLAPPKYFKVNPLDVPDYQLTVAIAQAFYRTHGRNAISTLLARYNATSCNELRPEDRKAMILDMEREYQFDWRVIKAAFMARLAHGRCRPVQADAQHFGRRQQDPEDSKPADLDSPLARPSGNFHSMYKKSQGISKVQLEHLASGKSPSETAWPWQHEILDGRALGKLAPASDPAPATEPTPDTCQNNVASDPPAPSAPDYCPAPEPAPAPPPSTSGDW